MGIMKKLTYIINVDWYFKLHWVNRALAAKKSGYDITIITHFTSTDIRGYFEELGFNCIELSFSRSGVNPFLELVSLFKLYKHLKDLQPNLVHCITVKPSIYGGLVSNLLRLSSLKSITGLGAVFSSESLLFRLLRPMVTSFYYMVGNSDKGAFIFENNSDRTIFERAQIGRKQPLIHIAGAGVDVSHFYEKSVALDCLERGKPLIVLFAARLLKDKGLDTLMSALDSVKRQGIDVELWVAGLFDLDSKNSYTEKEIQTLSDDGKIKWLGSIAGKEMPSVLNSVDIVALPTRYGEGIPRILIEAGATARVVLTSNVSGCNEFISDKINGRLLDPSAVEEWSQCIMDIVSNPSSYQSYAGCLADEVKTRYSDEVVIRRFLELYDTHCR